MNLIARVLSLLPARLGTPAQAWEGPIDQDLLAFNSLAKALHRSMRNLYEMALVVLFVRHRIRVPPADLATVSAKYASILFFFFICV